MECVAPEVIRVREPPGKENLVLILECGGAARMEGAGVSEMKRREITRRP
jgi:hypothetical protein